MFIRFLVPNGTKNKQTNFIQRLLYHFNCSKINTSCAAIYSMYCKSVIVTCFQLTKGTCHFGTWQIVFKFHSYSSLKCYPPPLTSPLISGRSHGGFPLPKLRAKLVSKLEQVWEQVWEQDYVIRTCQALGSICGVLGTPTEAHCTTIYMNENNNVHFLSNKCLQSTFLLQ